jgi:hypothetical protein
MIRLIAIAFVLLLAGSASAQTVRFPSVAVGGSAAGSGDFRLDVQALRCRYVRRDRAGP